MIGLLERCKRKNLRARKVAVGTLANALYGSPLRLRE
jgi:hypothetical protein